MKAVALGAVVGMAMGAVGGWSVGAFAASPTSPAFATTPVVAGAAFAIPKNSTDTWTLNLWSHGHLLGTQTAKTGTLSVAIPKRACSYQADVRKTASNGHVSFVEGARSASSCCPN
jgi:hypothetical protein